MQDTHLLQDLEAIHFKDATINVLRQQGITTCSRLFEMLRNKDTDVDLCVQLCEALGLLYKTVDKRRAASPLFAALGSENVKLRAEAAHALGILGIRKAIPRLASLVTNKNQPREVRIEAV